MTKQKVNNQEVNENIDSAQEQAAQQAEEATTDTVAEEQQTETDTVAEADNTPSAQEQAAKWQDKYIRLQAEFDNYRKRTLREKMDLVESGGKDVLMAMLSVLDDVYRAVEASE